jgi:hypothetical protein
MATIPRVALLVETSREYGREVLRGVTETKGLILDSFSCGKNFDVRMLPQVIPYCAIL